MASKSFPIWVVGVGPGDPSYMTSQVAELIGQAQVVAGFNMPLNTASGWIRGERLLMEYRNQEHVLAYLAQRAAEGQRCVVCAQGDPSFSGRELVQRVQALWPHVRVAPGISSMQVVCARAGLDLEQSLCITFHKRGGIERDKQEFLNAARTGYRHVLALPHPWDFMPPAMARFLLEGGVSGDRLASVYQRLSLPQESVTTLALAELAEPGIEFSDLSIFVLPRLMESARQ